MENQLIFSSDIDKSVVFQAIEKYLQDHNFIIKNKDFNRPWGGFFVIEETDKEKFINKFFPKLDGREDLLKYNLSPKILVVEPKKRLSWQYHFRRAELWKVIGAEAGVITSNTDVETPVKQFKNGDIVNLAQGERHRLIGLDSWGIIAEIWQHVDKNYLSDEDDIVRLQDDFGR